MLPDISGMDVLRQIRAHSDVCVIMLSAKGEDFDRILGLELGADDYVTKPYSPREVAIRIDKQLKRLQGNAESRQLQFAELRVNLDSYEVMVGKDKLDMTRREVELLSYMIENTGKVLSREMMLNAVWGIEYVGDTRCVDTQIRRIRQKLPTQNVHFMIRTVYGIGYRLDLIP